MLPRDSTQDWAKAQESRLQEVAGPVAAGGVGPAGLSVTVSVRQSLSKAKEESPTRPGEPGEPISIFAAPTCKYEKSAFR